jgi:hypothetical protein
MNVGSSQNILGTALGGASTSSVAAPPRQGKSRIAENALLKVAPFVNKVWLMMSREVHAITWQKKGTVISVSKKEQFAAKILPKYFHHANIATFVRQLNNYGFSKLEKDSSLFEFAHPDFRRNSPELLYKIKNTRKRRPPKKARSKPVPATGGKGGGRKRRKLSVEIADNEVSHLLLGLNGSAVNTVGPANELVPADLKGSFDEVDFNLSTEELRSLLNHSIIDFNAPSTATTANDIARIAREVTGMDIGLVNFLDQKKQIMYGNSGTLEYMNTCSRADAICHHVIGDDHPNLVVIPDCLTDNRTKMNPLVQESPFVRFYAGAPIAYVDPETGRKVRLGAVCVLDDKPHLDFGNQQKSLMVLKLLASLVSNIVQSRGSGAA